MPDKRPSDEVPGDGGRPRMVGVDLAEMKAAMDKLRTDAEAIYQDRLDAGDVRFCLWPGQAPDGLKHAAYNQNEEPDPFEGATDMRVRVADMVVNEEVMLLVISALRAQIKFKGLESADSTKAGNMTIFLRWLFRNYLGIQWVAELIKLANYYCGDKPGVALLGICWRREESLQLQTLTTEQLMEIYLGAVIESLADLGADGALVEQAGREAALQFSMAVQEQGDPAVLEGALSQFFPTLRPSRVKSVCRDLARTGKAEFPVKVETRNGPEVRAKRLFEDWFVAANTQDFQRAAMWFEPVWLSKVDVVARGKSEDWSDAFVTEVLKHEGVAAFPDYCRDGSKLQERPVEYYSGLYQVVTVHYRAINDEGIPGRYFVTLHKDVDVPAHAPRLLDYRHGQYPGVALRREMLNSTLMDSRGIPETAGVYQGLLKMHCDSFGDHAQIAGVPPIITRGRQRMGRLRIRPLAELQAKRDGDYRWMDPPQFPATVKDMVSEIRLQVDEYYGRPNKDLDPSQAQLHRDFRVMWWLMQIREGIMQIFQLCQQYMPDEIFARITNHKGEPIFKSREDIQGQFDLDLIFDPADLDPEHLETIGKIVKDMIMPMDSNKTINSAPVVASFLWRLAPDLAEASLQSVEQADAGEIDAEIKAYTQIRGGIEPALPDDGSINYGVRAEFYRGIQQLNPQAFADLPEDKAAILTSRLERLQVLGEQFGANVAIGRQGGKTALGEGDRLKAVG